MEQFDARMKSLLKDEYDDFKKALLEKPVKGLYLNRNKKNVERYVKSLPNSQFCFFVLGIKQILDNLRADVSFEDLIKILNAIGEKSHRIVPVFIDALNETGNQQLWEKGLIFIIDLIIFC